MNTYYTTSIAYILSMVDLLGVGFALTTAVGLASVAVATIVALIRSID